VIAIGTHEGVLWVVLPVAVLVAAYAPRAISFAVGQAGFTVFVLVLFNLLAPVGWRVGLVRAEDVAIGLAISLGVGLLFWPRGAAALVRQDLAVAYARAADYLAVSARQLIEGRTSQDPAPAARAADVAVRRLDETFRQYLGERSATPVNPEDIAALVAGASRVRRAAQSLTTLARMANGDAQLDGCGQHLDRELGALQTWYSAFGFALMSGGALPPPHIHDEEDARQLLSCVRDAVQGRGQAPVNAALALLVASQHLEKLSHLETLLSERANAIRTAPEDGGALWKLRVLAHPGPIPPGSRGVRWVRQGTGSEDARHDVAPLQGIAGPVRAQVAQCGAPDGRDARASPERLEACNGPTQASTGVTPWHTVFRGDH